MFKILYSLLRHDGRIVRCICWRGVLEIGRGRVGVRGGIGLVRLVIYDYSAIIIDLSFDNSVVMDNRRGWRYGWFGLIDSRVLTARVKLSRKVDRHSTEIK
jgi:hypothetical protein